MESAAESAGPHARGWSAIRAPDFARWIALVVAVYVLICAVSIIGSGFSTAAGTEARELFAFSENPFVGLMIGIAATALIQSSTSVTAIIVALVAGGLPVPIAVPMIMGCNMGTTLTNTIVSLGQVTVKEDFRRAFAAATIHDFFNLLCVVIFFPLEMFFHPLQKLAFVSADFLRGGADMSMSDLNFMRILTRPVLNMVRTSVSGLPDVASGLILILIGLVMILVSVYLVGKLMKQLMVGRAKEVLNTALGRGTFSGISAGTIITVIVQSSTTTTSLIVPLAGANSITLRQVYPFTLGANIGTTMTAILAATAVSGTMAVPALQIAFVHFYFSIFGVLLVMGVPFLRNLPIIAAEWLADLATRRKIYALAYVLGVFIVVPLGLIFVTVLI